MSHRRQSRASGSPPGDAGPAPTPEKLGQIRSWTVLGSDRKVLVLALVLAFRAANVLLVHTYFNPDEHWQCLVVAHRIAFRYAGMVTLHGSGSGAYEATSTRGSLLLSTRSWRYST